MSRKPKPTTDQQAEDAAVGGAHAQSPAAPAERCPSGRRERKVRAMAKESWPAPKIPNTLDDRQLADLSRRAGKAHPGLAATKDVLMVLPTVRQQRRARDS